MTELELLKENEALKLQLAEYENKYKPVYDKHMASVKEQALADYGLQADDVWLTRLTADDEQGIKEQVKALAVDLRIQNNNKPVDPGSKGNGRKASYKQVDPADYGRETFHRIKESGRLSKTVSSIKLEAPPVKTPQTERKKGILDRFFNR